MKILVLSGQFPHPGNPTSGIFVQEQAAALRRAGLDVRVLVGRETWLGPSQPLAALRAVAGALLRRPAIAWHSRDGVPVAEFPTIVLGRLGEAARSRRYSAGLRRVLKTLRDDFPFTIVHAHTALLDGAAAMAIKNATGVPFVLTEHTGPFSVITRTRAMRRRVAAALGAADRVVTVSSALAGAIRDVFPDFADDITVIPNGIDVRVFQPRPDRRQAASGRATVLWIGFLGGVKRPLLALAAFAAAAAKRPDLDLHMVGRGPMLDELHRAIGRTGLAGRVVIDDYQDRATLAGWMAAASALLVTSRVETFSLVTLEALSCGAPVVATRCGGPEDILVAPWQGRLVDDSPTALATALLDVIDSSTAGFAARRHAYATAAFGMDTIAARYAALYESVLAQARPRTNDV